MSTTIFADGTIYAKSKLDMVNKCILAIGEVPPIEGTNVEALPLGTDGETAKRIVETTMGETQARGWYFNTDYYFDLLPDVNNFITMPPNTLRVDFGNTKFRHQYTLKNGKIYKVVKHTFIISTPLVADVIQLNDDQTLPPEA